MLHWAEAHIYTLIYEHSSHEKAVFGVKASITENAAVFLLEYEGYTPF